jgi:glycosyltransferase involved in cell wall biosynthesis
MNHEGVILVLPSWYPSEVDSTSGDFVQRHIEAISGYSQQYVIHVIKDEHARVTKNIKEVFNQKNNYRELVIYYHIKKTGITLLDQFRSDMRYRRIYKKAIKKFIEKEGIPALVHVHVAMKAGLLACWIKRKYSMPFIVTEHSTAYLPEADMQLHSYGNIFKKRTEKILKESSLVTVVSKWLGKAIEKDFPFVKWICIPNVYNSKIFSPGNKESPAPPVFIHASIMNFQKNSEGIIHAFKKVKEAGKDFILKLFGPVNEKIAQLIENESLSKNVILEGEVSQQALAGAIRESRAVIMNSRFETFGCVLIEANACGIPAVVTDIPVFHEIIEENINGIFVPENDPGKLAKAIINFIDGKYSFDKNKICAVTEKYNYENVGFQFNEVYREVEISQD